MTTEAVEILLVEDNPNDVELTLRTLKKHNLGNRVKTLADGQQALDYLFSEGEYANRPNGKPRMMLLDLKLPKVSGLEVLKRVKADERTRRIPVVVLTSSAEPSDNEEAYSLGANSYVVKPVDFDDFSKAVAELGMYWMLINQPPA